MQGAIYNVAWGRNACISTVLRRQDSTVAGQFVFEGCVAEPQNPDAEA